MPGFDGTGPEGAGPMTGRGQGYCVMELPAPGRPAIGYAGLQGTPVIGLAGAYGACSPPFQVTIGPACAYGIGRPGLGCCRGRGRGRGRTQHR